MQNEIQEQDIFTIFKKEEKITDFEIVGKKQ